MADIDSRKGKHHPEIPRDPAGISGEGAQISGHKGVISPAGAPQRSGSRRLDGNQASLQPALS